MPKANSTPVQNDRQQWSPGASDATSIANCRVSLALLKLHRAVSIAPGDADACDVITALWPVIQSEWRLVKKGVEKTIESGLTAPASSMFDDPDLGPPDWALSLLETKAPPSTTIPDPGLTDWLAKGLLYDKAAFRPLFKKLITNLEVIVAVQNLPADRNLALIAPLLGLTDLECQVLRLSYAIEVSTIGYYAFAAVRRPSRKMGAIRAIFHTGDVRDVLRPFRPQGKLATCGLLSHRSVDDDFEDMLRLSHVGSLLLGTPVSSVQEMAALILRPLPESNALIPLAWPHLQDRCDMLRDILTHALRSGRSGINILLYGGPGTGKTEFARHLIGLTGASGFSVKAPESEEEGATRRERLSSLALCQAFAPADSSVLVLDEAEDIFDSDYNHPMTRVFGMARPGGKASMNLLLENNPRPVIWISNQIDHMDPAYLRRFTVCLEFPTTPRGLRRRIAQAYLEPLGCSSDVMDSIGCHPQVTPALLATASATAQLVQVRAAQADQAIRHLLQGHLKAQGHDTAGALPKRTTRFDTAYLNASGSFSPEVIMEGLSRLSKGTVLMSGPPGTGKTQLAAEIARRLGRELIYKTASDINSMWFGQSEERVAEMFTQCDPTSEILFLDEADTLLESRETSVHRANTAVTAEFLRRIEAFEGVFVCATNHPRLLDAALMRRFTFRLEFQPLNTRQRERLLCEVALGWNPERGATPPTLEPDVSARLGRLDSLTPGDFANVMKRVQSLQLALDVHGWVDELEAEHRAKPGHSRSAMGFV